jgi:hypothetical protein
MTDGSQAQPAIPLKATREADLALEVVLLLIYGVFVLLYGALVPWIYSGALPYSPDSAYGLFLVLVAIQAITLGKTPFGDLRRSWIVVLAGIATAVFGMSACFVPGGLTEAIRISVGSVLTAGGVTLLLQLLLSGEKGRKWIRIPGIPRHIAAACGLVYVFSIASGLITLFPGALKDALTAGLLVLYGASFLYLAWAVQEVVWMSPAPELAPATDGTAGDRAGGGSAWLLREASLPLSIATILLLAVLLTLLGLVLVAVNLGLIPFSPNGLQGLQLVFFALQMMSVGDTPVGRFKRSWLIIAIGVAFVGVGAFSCIVPELLTDKLATFLGLLNIFAGGAFFGRRILQRIRDRKAPPPGPIPPIVRKVERTQTVLNVIVIAFGATMFLPGLVPGLVSAVIIVANGTLLFTLAAFLWRLERGLPD